MTEADWLACDDPPKMLVCLQEKLTERKSRLFACACCRRVWHLLADKIHCRAVERSEEYADGLISKGALINANQDSEYLGQENVTASGRAAIAAGWASHLPHPYCPGYGDPVDVAKMTSYFAVLASFPGIEVEGREHAALLREIFGPLPFRPVPLSPAWRTATVLSLAQPIYDQRQFDGMPILGDAIEDAGCTLQEILNHCRQPGDHVKGCWVVDLILGKE